MRFAKFRRWEPLIGEYEADGPMRIRLRGFVPPLPYVTVIGDDVEGAIIRQAGYRLVTSRTSDHFGARYVRPFWLWAIHVACHAMHTALWGGLHRLWEHGLIGVDCAPGQRVRLRDIRPWPHPSMIRRRS